LAARDELEPFERGLGLQLTSEKVDTLDAGDAYVKSYLSYYNKKKRHASLQSVGIKADMTTGYS